MKIKYFAAWWGLDHLGLEGMIKQIKEYGFDGIECYIPIGKKDKIFLKSLLDEYELDIIAHQFEAVGNTFDDFALSFRKSLLNAAEFYPLKINSHTGKDFWTKEQNGALINIAFEIEKEYGVKIIHETHRGRFLYSAAIANEYFEKYPNLRINADFSHWVCVSESLLQDQQQNISNAISRADHIHARVGHEQGPQISDPRAKEWNVHLQTFMNWWQQIINNLIAGGKEIITITPEFGPMPYTFSLPGTNKPINDFFEINCWMKDYLKRKILLK